MSLDPFFTLARCHAAKHGPLPLSATPTADILDGDYDTTCYVLSPLAAIKLGHELALDRAVAVAERRLNLCYQRADGRGIHDAKATLSEIKALISNPAVTITPKDQPTTSAERDALPAETHPGEFRKLAEYAKDRAEAAGRDDMGRRDIALDRISFILSALAGANPEAPITWQPQDRITIPGRGIAMTGPYPFDTPDCIGRKLIIDDKVWKVTAYDRMANWGPIRNGSPCALFVKELDESPATPHEHWSTEQVKRAVIEAIVEHGNTKGMAVAARRAADKIIRLLRPFDQHRDMAA